MGWTSFPLLPDGYATLTFLRHQFSQVFVANELDGFAILADEITSSAYFAVIEHTHHTDETTERYGLICLFERSGSEITWNSMSESMGPHQLAPASFIDTLERYIPKPPDQYAADWRQRSRASSNPA